MSAAIFVMGGALGFGPMAKAQSVSQLFPLLPQACFEAWDAAEQPKLTPAARERLTAAGTAERASAAIELKVRDLKYDPQNGYLGFSSQGDGEGQTVEFTYWKERKGGTAMAAIVVNVWSAASDATHLVRFYRWSPAKPKSLEEVTQSFLPKLSPAVFFAKVDAATAKAISEGGWKWRWHLPQKGTAVRISAAEIGDDALATKAGEPKYDVLLEWNGAAFAQRKVGAKGPE